MKGLKIEEMDGCLTVTFEQQKIERDIERIGLKDLIRRVEDRLVEKYAERIFQRLLLI